MLTRGCCALLRLPRLRSPLFARLCPRAAGASALEDVLSPPTSPPSRTALKRRSEEMRKLGRALTRLPARTLDKMQLPSDLREALAERERIDGKRGTGSGKKGRARVEALMAQLLRAYPPATAAAIEAAATLAKAGEAFKPVGGDSSPRPRTAGGGPPQDVAAAALADLWLQGLLTGDAAAATDVFGSISSPGYEGLDRTALRNLVSKAVTAEAAAAAAVEAAVAASAAEAAAAAAEGRPPPPAHPPPARRLSQAGKALLAALQPLAAAALDADTEGEEDEEEEEEDDDEGDSDNEVLPRPRRR